MVVQPDSTERATSDIVAPPTTLGGTLARLGPGLIIAGSIVGSGELIATTKTGAQAGFSLLWLILVGCVIKVFTQVELGRYTLSSGDGCLAALNRVPGPRLGVNWLVWYWAIMMVVSLGQLGGIVGFVGQCMALAFPLQGDYIRAVQNGLAGVYTYDDRIWATLITAGTIPILVSRRYNLLQNLTTFLVAGFTFVTVGNVLSLPFTKEWSFTLADVSRGLIPGGASDTAFMTALKTFGIIGVGANELIAYPYWCLEKGYARFTGPREAGADWAERAKGWMRVMQWDAWLSMVVYTVATVAFYILGAAVLHRLPDGDADGMRMVSVLSNAYEPVFGAYAKWLFLFGAFAVLYSTFLVANAGHARITADCFRMVGFFRPDNQRASDLWVSFWCAAFPAISLAFYWTTFDPINLVLASGAMQGIMLPMLGLAAIYFNRAKTDPRLQSGPIWTLFFWLSVAGLFVSGFATVYFALKK